MSGFESDFRTGLPQQMTEIHDARRLLIYIFQSPVCVLKAIKSMPSIYEWVKYGWVHLVAQDPDSLNQYRLVNDAWTQVHGTSECAGV